MWKINYLACKILFHFFTSKHWIKLQRISVNKLHVFHWSTSKKNFRFWTIESIFFQSVSSPSPPCRRASAIENPPLRWFWWIFFQWIFPRGICCLQFIKVLNLRIIGIYFFSLVVKFVEQLSKNFIALYLYCLLMNLELLFF